MKKRSLGTAMLALFLAVPLMAATEALPVPTLAVIDPAPKSEFEGQKQNLIQSYLNSCKGCKLQNITPYNARGHFEASGIKAKLDEVKGRNTVVLVLWNRRGQDEDLGLVQRVKELIQGGAVFVATAGRPDDNKPVVALNRTLWGQISEVMVIGELTDRERLLPRSFFGPEMLTAIRTPADFLGQDMAAMIFSAKLLSQIHTRSAPEWVNFLKDKKATSKRMWPALDEFFGR